MGACQEAGTQALSQLWTSAPQPNSRRQDYYYASPPPPSQPELPPPMQVVPSSSALGYFLEQAVGFDRRSCSFGYRDQEERSESREGLPE
ncbi:hypothetical protein Tdes44962_MAKER09803 [Teratosphaeria destructans]|uniref:Uncharacterized protein n=1 Tax=Teratosphaeria destructans TaxID=418781 RepID=A0A9W7W211_9PEZI|nr:hypothetical protein Tdes44962_MAKER09803 [Teratosphaeria destructans]